jgi:hypothetical protein
MFTIDLLHQIVFILKSYTLYVLKSKNQAQRNVTMLLNLKNVTLSNVRAPAKLMTLMVTQM